MNTFRGKSSDAADDALDGLLRSRGGGANGLRRVARTGHTRVVVRSILDETKVSVISGGGAGHEPLHAGLVGPGLLSGAVSGGIFASPSADAVLTAIEATTNKAGCLLVIKNYTGDILNFRLAALRARERGYSVEEVLVIDDITTDARGIAGTILVHKVAGYFADKGATLGKVAKMARAVAKSLISVGVARNTGVMPGESVPRRHIPTGCVEVGIGIHGEHGVETCELDSAEGVIEKLCSILRQRVEDGVRYAAFFNNLGGLSVLECYALFNAFAQHDLFRIVDYTMGPAAIVTSLDMAGFSLTLLRLDPSYTDALVTPIGIPHWPGFVRVVDTAEAIPYTEPIKHASPSSNALVRTVLEAVLNKCDQMRTVLDELDAAAGDGDTGTTLCNGVLKLRNQIDGLPLNEPSLLFARLGEITARAMGGSLGAIIGILFIAMATNLPDAALWDTPAQIWGTALDAGVKSICNTLHTRRGDRTIIDALAPAAEALCAGGSIADAATAAREGAESTRDMIARAGRAAYVPEDAVRGKVDAGAEAVAHILEVIRDGRC